MFQQQKYVTSFRFWHCEKYLSTFTWPSKCMWPHLMPWNEVAACGISVIQGNNENEYQHQHGQYNLRLSHHRLLRKHSWHAKRTIWWLSEGLTVHLASWHNGFGHWSLTTLINTLLFDCCLPLLTKWQSGQSVVSMQCQVVKWSVCGQCSIVKYQNGGQVVSQLSLVNIQCHKWPLGHLVSSG
jgi:hypothetical protein